MRILYRYIIREHLGPFFLALVVLTLLLLMNELIQIMEMIIGKGVQVDIIAELLVYSIAWMLAINVPMAVLVSVMMAFGRFSRDGEITALRASGLSVLRLLRPVLLLGGVMFILMIYFNDRVLPDFNHRLSNLELDIRMMKPTLALNPGYFTEGVKEYTLYVESIDRITSRVENVIIVHYRPSSPRNPPAIIQAEWGKISFDEKSEILNFDLREGTITEVQYGQTRIQEFGKLNTFIDVRGTRLIRSESGSRGDRELPIADLRARAAAYKSGLMQYTTRLDSLPEPFLRRVVRGEAVGLPGGERAARTQGRVLAAHRTLQDQLGSTETARYQNLKRRNINLVEIHKKYSIPFSCLAFVLIGVPLALMARSGGAIAGFGYALAFYLIYWIFLVAGEYFGDRDIMSPWLSMWLPNIVVTAAGVVLLLLTVRRQTYFRWSVLAGKIPGPAGRWLIDKGTRNAIFREP